MLSKYQFWAVWSGITPVHKHYKSDCYAHAPTQEAATAMPHTLAAASVGCVSQFLALLEKQLKTESRNTIVCPAGAQFDRTGWRIMNLRQALISTVNEKKVEPGPQESILMLRNETRVGRHTRCLTPGLRSSTGLCSSIFTDSGAAEAFAWVEADRTRRRNRTAKWVIWFIFFADAKIRCL